MKVCIFVLQHVPCDLPSCYADRSIYRPIQCGRAVNARVADAIGDDEGENISSLNVRYNEATAIYWVGKHLDELGDFDYIGFDHYRRFLNWRKEWLAPDLVVARRWFSWRPLRGQYACCHDVRYLEIFLVRFREVFGSDCADVDDYWKTHSFYICNMFVMSRDNFRRYFRFYEKCISILRALEGEGTLPLLSDVYQRRYPGFILETMTSYWLWHERRVGHITVINSTIEHFRKFHGFLWQLRQAY